MWGLIAIGAVLILTEGWPRLRHSLDFNALEGAVMAAEETDQGVVESRAKELMTRYSTHETRDKLPSNELASPRVDTYKYAGLLSERVLYVYYGHHRPNEEPEVLAIRSEPVEFVYASAPSDSLQPQELDTSPVETPAN